MNDSTKSQVTFDGGELRLFVAETLQAVIYAIGDAESAISPPTRAVVIDKDGKRPFGHRVKFDRPKEISFDVAVTVTRKSGKQGGLKLEVLNVGGSIGADAGREQSVASRVSFQVPIYVRNQTDD